MAGWRTSYGSASSGPSLDTTNHAQPLRPQPMQSWKAADLLNPRGLRQATSEVADTSSHDVPSTQLSFEFSDSTNPASHQQNEDQHMRGNDEVLTNPDINGMGQMLERMHNISDRSITPQKRRKTPDDHSENSKRVKVGTIGRSSGILGDYVKEHREHSQTEAQPEKIAVDLSADDDDLVVLNNGEDREVCYGRIEGAMLNTHQVPTPKPGSRSLSPDHWPQIKIVLRRRFGDKTNIIHAVDCTRSIIGTVDINTSLGLTPILDSKYGIRTAARILARPKKLGDPPPGTEKISSLYPLDLNLYGPKRWAFTMGQFLSQKQLYLRTPMFLEAGTELFNPHNIQKPMQSTSQASSSCGHRPQGPVRTTEEIRNDVIGMFDSLQQSDDLPEMDQDPRVITELLKHQKQGLYFMFNKECQRNITSDEKRQASLWKLSIGNNGQKSYYNVITGQSEHVEPPQTRGGILADMMGLGKTLSILSLIMSTTSESTDWAKSPCIDVEQKPQTQKFGGKTALPNLEHVPPVQNAKTTLLVSPLSTISNWEEQIKQHIKHGTLSYYIYHGSGRTKDLKRLADYDLIITTYGSVASEFNHRSKKKQGSYPLEEMNWFRIVLDEAHMIREQSTQQSKAICRLKAQRRWAVTGTPVQNRLDDLAALMTFLRIKPFDEKGGFAQYIMAPFKLCDPDILPRLRLLVDSFTLRRLKDRIDLPARHDQLVKLSFSKDERMVYEVFAKNANDRVKVMTGQSEKILGGKSYVHILQSILRLRLICAHGRDLLGDDDLMVMDGISKDSAIDLDGDGDGDRPALTSQQAYDMYSLMKETNADACINCNSRPGSGDAVEPDGELKDDIIGYLTPCYHLLCTLCIDQYRQVISEAARGGSYVDCPMCHQNIRISYFPLHQGGVQDRRESIHEERSTKRGKVLGSYNGPHTKTKALIQDLLMSEQQSKELLAAAQPPIKSVVFSGWTTHLDLIQIALQANGISYTRLDGKMSRPARGQALDSFKEDPSIHVILVSITAGGLGLNLTVANKVYVMEPQYNPAAEAQAIDRVHRLGQKREVTTVRYIMSDSFEEKMLVLQDKKKKLATLSMDSKGRGNIDKAEAARQRLEDLRSLFK